MKQSGNMHNGNMPDRNMHKNMHDIDRKLRKPKKKKKKFSIGGFIFTVLIVFLSLTLVGEIIYILTELNDNPSRYYTKESTYISDVTYEDYYRILNHAIEDRELGRKLTTTEREIQALGYYYEAATLYKAYRAANDSESAENQKQRMARYKETAGSYASETEKIDEVVGIS